MTDDADMLARGVLATLDDARPIDLRTLALGLSLADVPVRLFGRAVDSLAVDLEHGGPPCALTVLLMKHALRKAALDGSLIVRLADAREDFWQTVAVALVAVAEDLLPANA